MTYIDSNNYEEEYVINLIKDWYLVRIFPDEIHQPLTMELNNRINKMNDWCNENCIDKWTAMWNNHEQSFILKYHFIFKNNSDSTHFSLVWSRTHHFENQ